MTSTQEALTLPHMAYPGIWDLKNGPNPKLLANYLGWVADDETRLQSAVDNTQWYPPGFHGLLVAIDKRPGDATHRATLRLNFYHPDHPGDEEPHAHSRDGFSSWYAPEGTNQILTRFQIVSDKAPRLKGLPLEERAVLAMNIGDAGNGKRPLYMPVELGRCLVLMTSQINVAALGSQRFDSTEVHRASFRGDGVAISVHHNGPEEDPGLNTYEGYVHFKNFTPLAAEQLVVARRDLAEQLKTQGGAHAVRLAPSTGIYPHFDKVPELLERGPIVPPSPEVAEQMILGALQTARTLAKRA